MVVGLGFLGQWVFEGWEGVSSSSEQAASSQESATGAFVALDLLEGEMESFFRELSRPEIL